MTKVFYPGTFDPITNGQLDIAFRAAALFDEVVIGIYARADKNLLFSVEERLAMVEASITDVSHLSAVTYDGLTVEHAREIGAQAVVRGLRVVSDFEHEFQMALMNRELAPDIDFICLMTSLEHTYLSSSIVKEVALYEGDVSKFVPAHVARALEQRLKALGEAGNDKVDLVSLKNG